MPPPPPPLWFRPTAGRVDLGFLECTVPGPRGTTATRSRKSLVLIIFTAPSKP